MSVVLSEVILPKLELTDFSQTKKRGKWEKKKITIFNLNSIVNSLVIVLTVYAV